MISRRTLLSTGALLGGMLPFNQRRAYAAEGTASATTGIPSLAGKTALITGSTDGLGRNVALRLANAGAHVIVHGRNRERGAAVVHEINALNRGGARFYAADFSSLDEVRNLARVVRNDNKQIHLLINNAGIGTANGDGNKERQVSKDGYEQRFAVNYLSGYVLTRELLPTLLANAPARIVNVASLSQHPIDFDNVMLERDYDGRRAYGQSKLAQIMFTMDLSAELADQKVTANSLHPATYMDTAMVRNAGVQPRSTVDEGAAAVIFVATSPALEGKSGLFFNGQREMKANAAAYDANARARLKALSNQLTIPSTIS